MLVHCYKFWFLVLTAFLPRLKMLDDNRKRNPFKYGVSSLIIADWHETKKAIQTLQNQFQNYK